MSSRTHEVLLTANTAPFVNATQPAIASMDELAAAMAQVQMSGKGASSALRIINNRAKGAATQTARMTHHATNLGFQFNDIAVMMAAGQNPLMLMMQQGTQVNQVFTQMVSGVKGFGNQMRVLGSGLGSALTQVINPMSLLVLGIIGGTATLVEWITSSKKAGEETKKYADAIILAEDAVKKYNTAVMAAKFGVAPTGSGELLVQIKTIRNEILQLSTEAKTAGRRRRNAIKEEIVEMQQIIFQLQHALAVSKKMEQTEWQKGEAAKQTKIVANQQAAIEEQRMRTAQDHHAMVKRMLVDEAGRVGLAELLAKKALEARRIYVQSLAVSNKLSENARIEAFADGYRKVKQFANETLVAVNSIEGGLLKAIPVATALANIFAFMADNLNKGFSFMARQEALAGRVYSGRGAGYEYGNRQPGGLGGTEFNVPKGGGGKTDQFTDDLEALREALMTEAETELTNYTLRQEMLKTALEQKLLTQQEYNALMEEAQKQHQDTMTAIDVRAHGTGLQKVGAFMGDIASALRQGNEKQVRIARVFGAAQALINTWVAAAQTLAEPGLSFFQKFAAVASVVGAGLGMVNAIKSGSTSAGQGGGPGASGAASTPQISRNVAIELTGGDNFSRRQVGELINQINEAVEDGAIIRIV